MKSKVKKGIINGIIFLFFVAITFYIVFKDNNILDILAVVRSADKRFILLAIFCMFFFIFAEGINISRTLKLLNCNISFRKGRTKHLGTLCPSEGLRSDILSSSKVR